MILDHKLYRDLVTGSSNICTVGAMFGLTEEEALLPGAGDWMVDCLKQVLTVNYTMQKLTMKQKPGMSVEDYHKDPFATKQNPFINLMEVAPPAEEKLT